ncbi:MAG: hypothetical protein WD181_07070 [Solirubrobacterales bacterium]
MGILDDAIREHLELKRQHGADESEVDELEAEAFGPADRPDATELSSEPPVSEPEAMTQVISPGSALTVPAGEGDQLDKVFEAKREEEATVDQQAAEDAEADVEPQVDQPDTPEPEAKVEPAEPSVIAEPDEPDQGEGDAGDALELERQHLAGQPTEHYDVDAAIAEEDEINLLSESKLSDELDRALEGPEDEPLATAPPEQESDPEPAVTAEDPKLEFPDEDDEDESSVDDSDFFDQNDPLEGTPDFLEETPEHDRLWFEQKEPKDFDFGD